MIGGGTRANVVPEDAYALVDMRVSTPAQADEMVAKVLALQSHEDGITVTITGGLNRPPYEKDERITSLFEHAQRPRRRDRLHAGGPQDRRRLDGNFTAALAPTLDGLGVDGRGGHTHYEQIYVSSIAPRSRLFYRLFETLQ